MLMPIVYAKWCAFSDADGTAIILAGLWSDPLGRGDDDTPFTQVVDLAAIFVTRDGTAFDCGQSPSRLWQDRCFIEDKRLRTEPIEERRRSGRL